MASRVAVSKIGGPYVSDRDKWPAPDGMSDGAAAVWRELLHRHAEPEAIVGPELEAYCVTVARARDAARRIDSEGAVVNDERGNPIEHPALAIERKAQAAIKSWGDRFQP